MIAAVGAKTPLIQPENPLRNGYVDSFMTVPEIKTMDRATPVAAWSGIFRTPVPKGLSKVVMCRFLVAEI